MKNAPKLLFFVFFTILFGAKYSTQAQNIFFKNDSSIDVIIKGNTLQNAWVGGMNSTTVTTLDCNLDGKDDLLVFDRINNKAFVFINLNNKYIYSKNASENLPTLSHYVLSCDFNHDGLKDLFTSTNLGIKAYKNISTTTQLRFKTFADPIKTFYLPSYSNLYINPSDIPSLSDIDSDGDLDLLHFNSTNGVSVIWEKNMSKEKYNNNDSLDFKQVDDCWGGFQEQTCIRYYFGFDCKNNFRQEHVGAGAVLALDMDNDGDKDLLIGKEDCQSLNFLENKGNAGIAYFNKLTNDYPTNNPAKPLPYPLPFFEDIDFDGVKDLVVSSGANPKEIQYDCANSIWWYKNIGTNSLPNFSFQSKNFLQNTMIDLGQNSHPTLTDFDNDGDLDLFTSNSTNMPTKGASIYLFENIGTKNKATFLLADTNYLNLAQFGYDELGIKFTDINNDNKTDLVLSTQKDIAFNTKLFLNESSNTYAFSSSTELNFDLSEIPSFEFYDIDKDNLKDALIGTASGELHYYRNTGTNIAPVFSLIDNDYGNIGSTAINLNIALIDATQDGITDLITSDDDGNLKLYSDFENQTKPFVNITIKEGAKNLQPFGKRLSMAMGDLNNDQKPEIIIGNDNGGLQLYFATENPNAIETNLKSDSEFNLFPNPNNGTFKIQSSKKGMIEIANLTGSIILKNQIEANKPFELATELPKGIYFVSLDKMGTKKIVIDR